MQQDVEFLQMADVLEVRFDKPLFPPTSPSPFGREILSDPGLGPLEPFEVPETRGLEYQDPIEEFRQYEEENKERQRDDDRRFDDPPPSGDQGYMLWDDSLLLAQNCVIDG